MRSQNGRHIHARDAPVELTIAINHCQLEIFLPYGDGCIEASRHIATALQAETTAVILRAGDAPLLKNMQYQLWPSLRL
ncbi:hypothetical protein D3C75_988780 [compost metagenome]